MKREVLIFDIMSLVPPNLATFLSSTGKVPQWRLNLSKKKQKQKTSLNSLGTKKYSVGVQFVLSKTSLMNKSEKNSVYEFHLL